MNHRQPRSHLGRSSKRPDRAGFGANHEVIYSHHLKTFYEDIDETWAELASVSRPSSMGRHARTDNYDVLRQYSLSNQAAGAEARGLGIVVLERWLTGKKARGNITWNRNDVGRIQTEIDRRIASLRIPFNENGLVEVELDEIVRLPLHSSGGVPRALGLIANQATPEAGYLSDAHTIALQGLGHKLKDHRDTAENFVPYLPLGAINEDVGPKTFAACLSEVRSLLPVTVELLPISFYS
ncbi:MAG TPA: hypothetical protein VFN51_00295, partial [Candidatus Saccharimonadales bacterium]|nr:hypothetical protein [Candidatus Saccharimonadales bacterium]